MVLISALLMLIRSLIVSQTALAAENLALRQQSAILNRKIHRPQLRRPDRFFSRDSLAPLEELAGGLDHRQTGDRHQIAQTRLSLILAMEVEGSGGPSEDRLRRTLRDYIDYYHNSRPHQALEKNSPTPREIEAPEKGKVIAIPQVGGLHHRYRRAA